MADFSQYSNSALRQVHAECKEEQYFSLHAKVIRLTNQGRTKTPEFGRVTDDAKRQFNVMVDIEREGAKRGLGLTH
ncbi:MAG: hypothetical protein JWM18_4244 [Chloroflexi bacterium]|nr:hypothetical protein [Chloroflexota bacterium]